jgi:hypothetical protein
LQPRHPQIWASWCWRRWNIPCVHVDTLTADPCNPATGKIAICGVSYSVCAMRVKADAGFR